MLLLANVSFTNLGGFMDIYKNCIEYIENKRSFINNDKFFSSGFLPENGTGNIKLLNCQKHFLKNIIDGKVTDCPRGMGKTMVIKLYSEYLNYISDMCKYDNEISVDDVISGDDAVKDGVLSIHHLRNSLYRNQRKAMKEYNISEKSLRKYVIPHEDLLEFKIGKE